MPAPAAAAASAANAACRRLGSAVRCGSDAARFIKKWPP